MNIVDAVFILIVLAGGVLGFKRGIFKELVMTIGFFLVLFISFKLKNPIANFLSYNLPFFSFNGIKAFNIILYQLISFLLISSLLMIIFRIVLKITGIFEKILKLTIVLGFFSKIIGFVVGLIEGYIVMFFVMFLLNQPILNVELTKDSKYTSKVLNSSPILSDIVKDTNDAIVEIYNLQKNYNETKNKNVYNNEIIRILLKYDIVDQDYINNLEKINKI